MKKHWIAATFVLSILFTACGGADKKTTDTPEKASDKTEKPADTKEKSEENKEEKENKDKPKENAKGPEKPVEKKVDDDLSDK